MPRFISRTLRGLLSVGLLLGGATPFAAVAAPADEAGQLADFFSGTLEIDVLASDWSAKRYLAADHTYDEVGSDGPVHGTWALQEGKVCTTADRSLGDDRLKTYCTAALGKHVGDTWRAEDPVTGNVVFFHLVAGRQETKR